MSVSDVVPEVKPAQIVDNTDAHTPDPETPPVVTHVPDPPRPDVQGLDALNAVVGQLGGLVGQLTQLVAVVVKPDADTSPVKVPWTHAGSKPHTDES